ncbi:hypothetical protein CPC08DRAFT_234222 [Agrocybe pediades]|nr:hypothetical protein CPC08DRAFT_234222 [Agrocybe pediades]
MTYTLKKTSRFICSCFACLPFKFPVLISLFAAMLGPVTALTFRYKSAFAYSRHFPYLSLLLRAQFFQKYLYTKWTSFQIDRHAN